MVARSQEFSDLVVKDLLPLFRDLIHLLMHGFDSQPIISKTIDDSLTDIMRGIPNLPKKMAEYVPSL